MLNVPLGPIGVLVVSGFCFFFTTGIQENLADKARKLGIPVWKHGEAAGVSVAFSSICQAP